MRPPQIKIIKNKKIKKLLPETCLILHAVLWPETRDLEAMDYMPMKNEDIKLRSSGCWLGIGILQKIEIANNIFRW